MPITRSSLIVLAGSMLSGAIASAAIIPSWRVNTIPTPAPNPVLEGAYSVSLMVELTGGSQFNVAGLDLSQVFSFATLNYFNQTPFGSDTKPSAALIAVFPDLAFDTYVGTTTDAPPAVPGKLNGTGAAQVGTGGQFNVSWGATPNTGGTGPQEIARITIVNGGAATNVLFPIPLSAGLVADSLNPNANVALPPIPAPASVVPEPAAFALAGIPLLFARRSRR